MDFRILVCGDRNWTNYSAIRNTLKRFCDGKKNVVVIDGACRGADNLGHKAAKALGFKWQRFPADWTLHGKAAGPIRNREMVEKGKPELVLAFHNNIDQSRGTRDMLYAAKEAGVTTKLFRERKNDIKDFLKYPPRNLYAMLVNRETFRPLVDALKRAGNREQFTDLRDRRNWPNGAIRICESAEVPTGKMATTDAKGKILKTYSVD